MSKNETLTLFPEIETATRKLSNEQFGELMRAVMAYRWRGDDYSGTDPAIDIAFQFLSNQVDRGEANKAAKSKAARGRWEKQTDAEACTAMQSDAQRCRSMHNDAEACTAMQSDAPILSYPIQSYPIQSYPKERKAAEPPAPTRPDRKSFGEFGWVKLSDAEYNRLLNDLGEAEVKRCIAYVDESAQTTGNKNGWRDWNLVVRKCHKQSWGLDQGNKPKHSKKNGTIYGASGELGEAELEAIRRTLAWKPQENPDDGNEDPEDKNQTERRAKHAYAGTP